MCIDILALYSEPQTNPKISHPTIPQPAKPSPPWPRQQHLPTLKLHQPAPVKHGNAIESLDHGIQFVHHGQDRVPGELVPDDALRQGVGVSVDV